MFLSSMLFASFNFFSLLDFSSSVSSWWPARLGVVSGLAAGGAVPWTVSTRVAKGFCTLVRGLLSAWVGVVSVAALPAAYDRDLSVWLVPKGSFFLASGLSAWPCLLVAASVCVVWVCVRMCGSVYMSVGGLGSFDFLYLIVFVVFVFLMSVRHFVLLAVWKVPYKKDWFD